MDKISEFIDEIKERLSNPFISSFIISWTVFNYKIPIGLVLYDIDDLEKDGYSSYLNLIERNLSAHYNWIYPLIFALLYTLLGPWLKALINEYQTRVITRTDRRILNITKETTVPVEKYLRIQDYYSSREKKLQLIIEREKEVERARDEYKEQRDKLEDRLRMINENNDRNARTKIVSYFDGNWRIKITTGSLRAETFEFRAKNGVFYYLKNDLKAFTMKNFMHGQADSSTKYFFQINRPASDEELLISSGIYFLITFMDEHIYEGYYVDSEGKERKIRFERMV